MSISFLLACLAATALASPVAERQTGFCTGTDYPCTSGVLVLAARGTDETYTGSPSATNPNYDQLGTPLESLARNVTATAGSGSYCRALPYAAAPGSLTSNPPLLSYFVSIGHGVDVGQGIIKDYADRCGTSSRIVLLGYSQGGQTMTSVLIGAVGKPNLDAYQHYITGGAFFASPSFVANIEPIDAGNATTSGTFARTATDYARLNEMYGTRIRSFCQAGDEFCASGGSAGYQIHLDEPETYRVAAEEFLATLV